MIQLRDYQARAKSEIWSYWREGKGTAPLAVLATGAGKSILLASIINDIQQKNPDARIIMATHVKELIEQNMQALLDVAPDIDAGILSAGLNSRDTDNRVIFAGVQTAYRRDDLGAFALLIVDECHLLSRNASSMYGQLIENLRRNNPDMRLLGLTATPYRLDSGPLHEGPDALFDGIACEVKTAELVERGYLCPMKSWAPGRMNNLKVERGEYTPESQRLSINENLEVWARKIVDRTAHLKTLVFVPSVAIAEMLMKLLCEHGLAAGCITGDTESGERRRLLDAFRSGSITHMTNVNVMTTGMNIPDISAIVLMRATTSPGLLEQMLGRGLRTAEGKSECLLLDFGGNTERHGFYDSIAPPPTPEERGNLAKRRNARTCPDCGFVNPLASARCEQCGHAWTQKENLLYSEAYSAGAWHLVSEHEYKFHLSRTGKQMVLLQCRLETGKTSRWYGDPQAIQTSWPYQAFRKVWDQVCPYTEHRSRSVAEVVDMMNSSEVAPIAVRFQAGKESSGFVKSIQFADEKNDVEQ